jgi:hypothetical protein
MEILREVLSYLQELKLVHTSQLSELRPLVAVDGESYIQNMLQEDFYSQVLGGCNFTLKSHLTFALRKFKEKGITPVFIFNGIPLRTETAVIAKRYKRSQKLWEKMSKHQGVDIEKILIKQEVAGFENLREIYSIVRAEGGEVMKAPSYSGFQLAHLEKNVAAVMGSVDLLCFGLGKIVLEVDFEGNSYSYILASDVFRELKISQKRFSEILISKGLWTGKKLLKTPVIELLQEGILQVPEKEQPELEKFYNLIDSEFYLSKDLEKVHFKSLAEVQNLFPSKNQEHLFYALCLLPLSSSLLSAFVKKVDVMTPPVADSLKYRALVSKYKPIMRKVYSVLFNLFENPSPGTIRGIKTFYWYDEIQPFQLDFEVVKELNFSAILEKFEVSGEKNVDIQSVCKFHIALWKEAKETFSTLRTGPDTYRLKTLETLKLKIFFKVFHATGLIGINFEPTLFEYILTLSNPVFQSQILVILELLKLGLLDWKSMSLIKVPESVLKKIAPDSDDQAKLISRVCSLVPATLSHDTWTSSVDHDLAQFYSMTSHISKVHSYLSEVFLLEEFISGRVEISNSSVSEYLNHLQLVPLNSVIVGILVKKVLEGKSVVEITKEIPQAIDIVADLEKAWWFWKEFVNVLWLLTKDTDDVRGLLDQASKKFKTTLINSGIHVI